MDWVYLAVGGFLLGSVAYTGWFTTRAEPEAKAGYGLIGAGTLLVVAVTTWVDFQIRRDTWVRIVVLGGFALVTAGLILLVRERRRRWR